MSEELIPFELKQRFVDCFGDLQTINHQAQIGKGWWDERLKLLRTAQAQNDPQLEKFTKKAINSMLLALCHSELSEALEGDRKDLDSDHLLGLPMLIEELADTVIRLMDMSEYLGFNLGAVVVSKMEYNATRSHKHGGKSF